MQSCTISIFNNGKRCHLNNYFARLNGANTESQDKLFLKLKKAVEQIERHEGFNLDVVVENHQLLIEIRTMDPVVGRILTNVWKRNEDLIETAYYNTAIRKEWVLLRDRNGKIRRIH